MFRTLKCDFSRVILNFSFLSAVLIIALLCFSEGIYTDPINGKTYSTLESLLSLDKEFIYNNISFHSLSVVKTALSGYSSMILPVTVSFPFVFAFITERNSENIRYTISRTGEVKYCISKFTCAAASGGVCAMLGVMLFSLFCFMIFPSNMTEKLPQNTIIIELLRKYISTFLYGLTSTMPAILLCSFCKNPYIILCLPFLGKFVLETVLSKIEIAGINNNDYDIFSKTQPLKPNSASVLPYLDLNTEFYIIVTVNIILISASAVCFVLIMVKRTDKGV